MFGQGAELAFGESLRRYVEGAIEARPGVFPGDDGGEFDELALREMSAERSVEFVRDIGGRAGERAGEAQDELLLFVEIRAGVEPRDSVELGLSDSGLSADGRMDVDSKRTADHERSFELREFLEMHRHRAFPRGVEVHAHGVAQEFGIVGADTRPKWDAPEEAFGEEEDEAGDQTGLIVLNSVRAKHRNPPL